MTEVTNQTHTTEPLMNVTLTLNADENSRTVHRDNGTRLDFCHMPNLDEVIIGETTGVTGDEHHQIILSMEEARALQSHLATVLG